MRSEECYCLDRSTFVIKEEIRMACLMMCRLVNMRTKCVKKAISALDCGWLLHHEASQAPQSSMHQHHQTSSWLLGANWRMIFPLTWVWEHIIKALWLTWWNLKSSHLTMLLSSQAWPTKPRLLVGHLCQTQVHNRTEMEPEICQDQSKTLTSQQRLLMATIGVLVQWLNPPNQQTQGSAAD